MYLYCSCRAVFIGGEDYTTSTFLVSYFRCMCRLTKQQKMKTQKSWLRISLENWRNMMSRHCQFGSNLETSVLRNTSGFIRYKSSKWFLSVLLVKWSLSLLLHQHNGQCTAPFHLGDCQAVDSLGVRDCPSVINSLPFP